MILDDDAEPGQGLDHVRLDFTAERCAELVLSDQPDLQTRVRFGKFRRALDSRRPAATDDQMAAMPRHTRQHVAQSLSRKRAARRQRARIDAHARHALLLDGAAERVDQAVIRDALCGGCGLDNDLMLPGVDSRNEAVYKPDSGSAQRVRNRALLDRLIGGELMQPQTLDEDIRGVDQGDRNVQPPCPAR